MSTFSALSTETDIERVEEHEEKKTMTAIIAIKAVEVNTLPSVGRVEIQAMGLSKLFIQSNF